MASTMSLPEFTLQVPAIEDSMEISSDVEHGDDIDIDIDGFYGNIQNTDDERMLEDVDFTQDFQPTAKDDDMIDGDIDDEIRDDDGMMEDDTLVPEQQDEDLPDMSENELDEQEVQRDQTVDTSNVEPELSHGPTLQQESEAIAAEDIIDEEIARDPDFQDAALDKAGCENDHLFTSDAVDTSLTITQDVQSRYDAPDTEGEWFQQQDVRYSPSQSQPSSAEQTGQTAEDQIASKDESAAAEFDQQTSAIQYDSTAVQKDADPVDTGAQASTDNTESQVPAINVNTVLPQNTDGPATPTATGLHPTLVSFEGSLWSLFPAGEQEHLLDNDNWASNSLADLMQECRRKLQEKLGQEYITQEEELELTFLPFGLSLISDTTPAFATSLSDVLDIYVQLHRNEDAEDIPPLNLILARGHEVTFTRQLALLKQNAYDGHGMSELEIRPGQLQPFGQYAYSDVGNAAEDLGNPQADVDHENPIYDEQDVEKGEHYAADQVGALTEETKEAADAGTAVPQGVNLDEYPPADDYDEYQNQEYYAEDQYPDGGHQDEEQHEEPSYELDNDNTAQIQDQQDQQDHANEQQETTTGDKDEDTSATLVGDGTDDDQKGALSSGSSTVQGDNAFEDEQSEGDDLDESTVEVQASHHNQDLENFDNEAQAAEHYADHPEEKAYADGHDNGEQFQDGAPEEATQDHKDGDHDQHETTNHDPGESAPEDEADQYDEYLDYGDEIAEGEDDLEYADHTQEPTTEGTVPDDNLDHGAKLSAPADHTDEDGGTEGQANGSAHEDAHELEDFIDFDDKTTEEYNADLAEAAKAAAAQKSSPSAKRSYDDHNGTNELSGEEPELKKVRSS